MLELFHLCHVLFIDANYDTNHYLVLDNIILLQKIHHFEILSQDSSRCSIKSKDNQPDSLRYFITLFDGYLGTYSWKCLQRIILCYQTKLGICPIKLNYRAKSIYRYFDVRRWRSYCSLDNIWLHVDQVLYHCDRLFQGWNWST